MRKIILSVQKLNTGASRCGNHSQREILLTVDLQNFLNSELSLLCGWACYGEIEILIKFNLIS